MVDWPTGTVTFLFTDIEGSTQLLQRLGARYAGVLDAQRALLRAAFAQHGGHQVDTQGDSFFVAFARALDAVQAAVAAQRALAAHPWPDAVALRVRMGLHTGEPTLAGAGYVGLDVHRAARIAAAGHGGQVLLSETTQALVKGELPAGVTLRDLGEHRLKDLRTPKHLYQLVIAGLPAEFPPLRSLDALPNNLPTQLTSFIGREREIEEVKRLLWNTRLLTLTGSGGCGKTRLALEVAADVLDAFQDGTWFVELAPLSDAALIPQTVASVLGLREAAGQPLLTLVCDYLRAKRALLILDNCEHMIAECAAFADSILRAAPNAKILASSREALGIAGETAYRVPSLAIPDPRHLPPIESLTHYDAVRLFAERASAAQPSFTMTHANAPAVAQMCHQLDGIPLAIELAAARVKMLSVEQITARLDDRFRLLTGGSRTALPRHQTLRALIDWSYSLLSEAARALLRRLSVFAGGWTLDAVEAICAGDGIESGEVLDWLTRLVDKSLVIAEEWGGAARYRLLETIRQYAREKLLDAGEVETIRHRHLDFFMQLAEEAEPKLHGSEQIEWLDRLEEEHDNLRAALEWSLERNVEAGLQLAGALWWFWHLHGHLSEGYERLEKALAVSTGAATPIRAKLLSGAGWLAAMLNYNERSVALSEESVALFRELGDRGSMAFPLATLGTRAYYHSDYDRATTLMEQSLALFKEAGSKWGMRHVLGGLGYTAEAQGNFERAAALYKESLALSRELGDKDGIGWTLHLLGNLASSQGNYEQAMALYEESLPISREVRNKPLIAWTVGAMGDVALQRGNYEQARTLAEESLELNREMGDKVRMSWSLIRLGEVARIQGDHKRAAIFFDESLTLAQEIGDKETIALCLAGIAGLAGAQGSLERAAHLFGAAEAIAPNLRAGMLPATHAGYEQTIAAARAQLDETAFNSAWAEGRAMNLERAIAYALEETAS